MRKRSRRDADRLPLGYRLVVSPDQL